jgi:hypothetical protein
VFILSLHKITYNVWYESFLLICAVLFNFLVYLYCCAAQFLPGCPGRSPVDISYWGNTGECGELTHIHLVYNITKNITCIRMSNYTRVQHLWNFTITNPKKPETKQNPTGSVPNMGNSTHEHNSHRSTPNSAS